ncbi:M28 family peptidase [bacterium]|nr:M28 family peptidase [bacterium]
MTDEETRAYQWIETMTTAADRFAGTSAERRVAEQVGEWMRGLGCREVAIEPVASAPRSGAVLALHAGVSLLGLWWGNGLGAALAVLSLWSFRSHLRRRVPRLARLLPAPESVNVVGRCGATAPTRRVVLSAHIDSAQAGVLFSKRVADAFAGLTGRRDGGRPPIGPLALPEGLIIAGALVAVAGWLGAHGLLFGLVKLVTAGGLLLTAALTLQWALSPPTPGANDNASAVAAMLTCAERLLPELPADVELWVVGTGAEEVGCCGMHAFVERHRDWPREHTYFVNFECVGGGHLHYIRSEGVLEKGYFPPRMNELARQLASDGRWGAVTPTDLLAATDGHVPAAAGYPALSLISLEANGVPRNYHRVEDTVEALDIAMVVRAADFGAAVAMAALRRDMHPAARTDAA